MNEISIGAVGAAVIAGLVSMLGLIIGKEQKVSEFRQAWINDLRKCVVDYLVNINAICDMVRLRKAGEAEASATLLSHYKSLNEASHGITLRINGDEKTAKSLLASMKEFEGLAQKNESLTPEKIREVEADYIIAAKELLKFEWRRVKKGEPVFVWTKRVIFLAIVTLLGILAYHWYNIPVQKSFYEDLGLRLIQLLEQNKTP
jgi:hypothetical protein